ncbi:hypothetical protein SLOPH_1083 [Spraguea lophii 42_110]|uniref:Ricin B lectin domain-containing protein n=1 Tax=Spraguea lophii (strain 42_110) TaxID=1358809 RepID=S7W9Z4_SPRLO|nr:hypothetical protein SLOPH_1083 [Spraguea lophii 42_110]
MLHLFILSIFSTEIIISPSSNPDLLLNDNLQFSNINSKSNKSTTHEYSIAFENGMYYTIINTSQGYIVSADNKLAISEDNTKKYNWNIVPLSNGRYIIQSQDNKCWKHNTKKCRDNKEEKVESDIDTTVQLEDCPQEMEEIPFNMMFNLLIFPSKQEKEKCKELLENNKADL